MPFKRLILCGLAATATFAVQAVTPLWTRNANVSPDGETIAFTYKGDIFTVPVSGGRATRLTTQPSYETTPIWSPDSKKIAFASDRHGNFDIYVTDIAGGTPTRLTFNQSKEIPEAFSPDGSQIYYSAAIQMPAASAMFPSGRMTQLYSVPVAGGSPKQVLGTPVQEISFMPDGKSFLYQDIKGFENEFRKHHTSSVTRDIWLYDAINGTHTNLTDRAGEDRNPVVTADGTTVYYLAEMPGKTFNVYTAPVSDMKHPVAVTSFETHPVRHLSRSNDGRLVFTYNGEIYTMTPGVSEPQKVNIDITIDEPDALERLRVGSPKNGSPSPDGKQWAYTDRGNVFVTSIKHESTRQITDTPAEERSVTWGPDSRSLIYTSMRDGHYNIYKATIDRDDDPNFSNATVIEEKPLIAADSIERTNAEYSPDGKMIAFIQDRRKLMVMDAASGKVRQLTDGSNYPASNGSYSYQWSPDSKWIVIEDNGNMHQPYSDIAIINVATGEKSKITNSGYMEVSPRFVMGGNAIVFLSERYGMRSHASWGSLNDVMIAFLNRESYDKFRLSEEELELREAIENQNKDKGKDKDKKTDKDKDKKGKGKDKDDADDKEKTKPVEVDLRNIEDRIVRLTPYSSDLTDAFVTNDAKTLFYISSVEDGYNIWKIKFEDMEPKKVNNMNYSFAYFIPTADGKTLYVGGEKVGKFDMDTEKIKGITAGTTQMVDHAAERDAMLDQVYISEREMFYTPDLHGADWDGLTADYRRFLPHINNNYDFSEMLSELLGELNVSHTGSGYRGNEASEVRDYTASLGLLYDMAYTGEGWKVDEIITGGPFDNSWTALKPGFIIKSINRRSVGNNGDHAELLNNLSGKRTLVTIEDPATGRNFEEVMIPVSKGTESQLLYDRWVKNRAADVDKWSNGRLGYVHIESMNDDSFRRIYSDLLGKYINKEGVVIDIRWNGGGRLHEDIEVLFSGEKYISQVIRGVETCDMPSRRWNKPSIMVMSEACYSNAHGTPWVYKHKNLGKLVGMPVPGTMTSVNWVTLQDPTLYFGIPVTGMRIADGSYLENQQLEPDIKVANKPEDIVNGEDAQLRAAVEELLREIDEAK